MPVFSVLSDHRHPRRVGGHQKGGDGAPLPQNCKLLRTTVTEGFLDWIEPRPGPLGTGGRLHYDYRIVECKNRVAERCILRGSGVSPKPPDLGTLKGCVRSRGKRHIPSFVFPPIVSAGKKRAARKERAAVFSRANEYKDKRTKEQKLKKKKEKKKKSEISSSTFR